MHKRSKRGHTQSSSQRRTSCSYFRLRTVAVQPPYRRSLTKLVTNNVTVYQFEVALDEVFADEVRFHVNVDCVIVVVVKDCLFFMSFILCENCEFVKWMCWMLAFLSEL